MIVTQREQQILEALQHKKSLTVAEMMKITRTSQRTLYRDLESIYRSLPDGVTLIKTDGAYQLTGNLSNLVSQELQEFTAKERLYCEILLLLTDEGSIHNFTEKLRITKRTATSDLRIIDKMLAENNVQLLRDKGLKVMGNEEEIRSLFVSALLAEQNFENKKIIKLLDSEYVTRSYEVFEKVKLPKMTDKTKNTLQLFLATSLIRQSDQHVVKFDNGRKPSKQAISFVNQLISSLQSSAFNIAEIIYLASVYDVLYFGFGRQPLFLEKFDSNFSYKIRLLIEKVSKILNIEFFKDDRLYGLLYAHLKEIDLLPELFVDQKNIFVKQIEIDNEKIFSVVKTELPKIFQKRFSSKEISFVTMHFVATLERSDLVMPLTACIVSVYGRISCELLINNLQKNFPFLKQIDIMQPSTKFDPNQYDVIFTTEHHLDYIYVDRYLQQKNLDDLRHRLRDIQQNGQHVTSNKVSENFVNINQLFAIGQEIIEQFEIQEIKNVKNLSEVVAKITEMINLKAMSDLLIQRFKETHLAIPETKIALLHGVHEDVQRPYFAIFDLDKAITLPAMDGKETNVSRILFLISPTKVAQEATIILGRISSSIIENKLYTKIYESGNDEIIRELLKRIVSKSIKNY